LASAPYATPGAAEIAGRGDLSRVRVQNPSRRIANQGLQDRIIELRMIERVEKLGRRRSAA
jgi:hypothetical protein